MKITIRLFVWGITVLLVMPQFVIAGMVDTRGAVQVDKTAQQAIYKGCPELKPDDNTSLDIISQVIAEKRAYAALAFIESANFKSPRLDLLKANSLFQVGKYADAEKVYESLKSSCVSGFAYQGLGLINSKLYRYPAAVDQLSKAARLMPVDSAIRGDYGYALMQNGNYEEAKSELLTAIELDPKNQLAKNNLVLLLYKYGQTDRASQLAKIFGITSADEKLIIERAKIRPVKNSDRPLVIGGNCPSNQDICTGILSPQLESLMNENPH